MASTFILAFTLGASGALGGNPITDAFGVIAMIAMMPLITIQILGILFSRKEREAEKKKHDRICSQGQDSCRTEEMPHGN